MYWTVHQYKNKIEDSPIPDNQHFNQEQKEKSALNFRTFNTVRLLYFSSNDPSGIFNQANEKLRETEQGKLKEIARELAGTDPFQFIRAYTPG